MDFGGTVALYIFAPVSEMSCPLPEVPSKIRSPSCRGVPPAYGVSQTLCARTKWKGKFGINKLSKNYIGSPNNFRHLCHIGWNPQTGFATNLDPELKMIIAHAGVTQDVTQETDKTISKNSFETIEKQGGREAVLKEKKTKGLQTKCLNHSVPCSVTSSELVPGCTCINELDCHTLSTKDGLEDGLAVPALISELEGSLHRESNSTAPECFTSPSKRTSQYNLILNMKEVQLKKAKNNQLIPSSQDVLLCQTRKGTQLQPVIRSSTALQPPVDGGIVAELKEVIQKRRKAICVQDEESSSENGDEWAD